MSTTETRRRDPVSTRRQILEAAESLFVARGFAATSMNEVARKAQVTKSLIHHHFGSKEELWQQVKADLAGHWAESQKTLIKEGSEGADILRQSVESYFDFLRNNPDFVRISTWMSLEDRKANEPIDDEIVGLGIQRIREEQARGSLRSDISPENLIVIFVGLCQHWFAAMKSRQESGLVEDSPDADDRYLEDMLKVFLRGVQPG